MKKLLAVLLILILALALTGCVSTRNAATVEEDEIDRPTVTVVSGETELTATVETTDAETGENNTEIIYNEIETASTLTLSGKHASGISRVSYRFVYGAEKDAVVVTDTASVDVVRPDGATAVEVYVTNGNGIVSQWATYYFA